MKSCKPACVKMRTTVLQVPPGYMVILEDRHTMADKSFYIPGLSEANRLQWNKVAPSLRILVRQDLFPLEDRLNLLAVDPPTRGYKFNGNPHHLQQMQMQIAMGMGLPMGGMTMGHNQENWQGRMQF